MEIKWWSPKGHGNRSMIRWIMMDLVTWGKGEALRWSSHKPQTPVQDWQYPSFANKLTYIKLTWNIIDHRIPKDSRRLYSATGMPPALPQPISSCMNIQHPNSHSWEPNFPQDRIPVNHHYPWNYLGPLCQSNISNALCVKGSLWKENLPVKGPLL